MYSDPYDPKRPATGLTVGCLAVLIVFTLLFTVPIIIVVIIDTLVMN